MKPPFELHLDIKGRGQNPVKRAALGLLGGMLVAGLGCTGVAWNGQTGSGGQTTGSGSGGTGAGTGTGSGGSYKKGRKSKGVVWGCVLGGCRVWKVEGWRKKSWGVVWQVG